MCARREYVCKRYCCLVSKFVTWRRLPPPPPPPPTVTGDDLRLDAYSSGVAHLAVGRDRMEVEEVQRRTERTTTGGCLAEPAAPFGLVVGGDLVAVSAQLNSLVNDRTCRATVVSSPGGSSLPNKT